MADQERNGDRPRQDCKMFIGGLHLSTEVETLKDYFSKWGSIIDAVVMTDGATKRSRGFGFVTYSSSQAVDDCLAAKPHVIDGKDVEVKRALPRDDSNPMAHQRTKKVFLGGLSPDTVREEIQDVLEQYGKVMDVQIMTEKGTNKPRGFGFAIFDDCDTVDKICIKKFIRIKDRDVEVKKAISQEEMRKSDMSRRPPPAASFYGARDQYGGGAYGGRAMGFGDYSRIQTYDYSRYPEYMRPESYMGAGAYGMTAYPDRTASAYQYSGYRGGYDMQSYSNPYTAATMGAYNQASSSYGPMRGYAAPAGVGGTTTDVGRDRDRTGARQTYHPYRR